MMKRTKENKEKSEKMTLKDYVMDIPLYSCPRSQFLNDLAEKCNVTVATARNWCLYGVRPNKLSHWRVISDMTNIPIEDLWQD